MTFSYHSQRVVMLVWPNFFHKSPLTTFCLTRESIFDTLYHNKIKLSEVENHLFCQKSLILVAMVTGSCEVQSFASSGFWKA